MPAEIETRRLQLRPITFDDLPALAQLWGDPEVMEFLPTGEPRSVKATRVELSYMANHWQEHGFGTWAVRLKGESVFIGYCGIQYLHQEPGGVSAEALRHGTDVEVIAGLARPYWGQGIASEATEAVLRYGFETVRLPRIVAAIHPANDTSRHILEKMGLKYDAGINYYGDCPHFVIRREEYQMEMTKSRLLQLIQSERALLEATLAQVREDRMDEPGACGEWSVKDVLAHIAAWEELMVRCLREVQDRAVPGLVPYGIPDDALDELNGQMREENREKPLDQVLKEFERSYGASVREVEATPEEELLAVGRVEELGNEPLWHMVAANTCWHYRDHRASLEAWQEDLRRDKAP